jgi:hypothetical protein
MDSSKWKAIGGVIAALAGIVAIAAFAQDTFQNRATENRKPSVTIKSPTNGAHVPRAATVQITVNKLPGTRDLWIAVKAPDPARYYPQGRISNDGDHAIKVNVGAHGSSTTKQYTIVALITDSAVTEYFRKYCSNRANYPAGMQLPKTGWDPGAEVRVTRAQTIDASTHANPTCRD